MAIVNYQQTQLLLLDVLAYAHNGQINPYHYGDHRQQNSYI